MKSIISIFVFILLFNYVSGQGNMNEKPTKALLIIDIQNDYFENGANPLVGSWEASLKAKEILNRFRNNKLPVIFIKHISNRPGSTFFLPDTKGSEIHNNIAPIDNEKIIIKHYPNSFRETELLDYLKSNNISDLVICGMMTQMCVDATVRAAKDFGYNCTLISDACATKDLVIQNNKVSAREVQNAFLAALNYFYSKVVTAKEYLNEYDK